MKFIVKPRQFAWHKETLWSEGQTVDLAHITEKDYEAAKKAKPSKDLVPWGVPATTKEAEDIRAKVVQRLKGEGQIGGVVYGEDSRVRAEQLLEEMRQGPAASRS